MKDFSQPKKKIEVMDVSLLNTVLSFVGVIFHNCMKVKDLRMKRSPLNISHQQTGLHSFQFTDLSGSVRRGGRV